MRTLSTLLRLIVLALLCLILTLPALSQVQYPAFNTPNIFSNSNQFLSGVYLGPQVFANLPSLVGSTNVVVITDGTAGSNPCTGGGTGALAIYVGGQWNCQAGSGSGGGTSVSSLIVGPSTPPGISAILFNGPDPFGLCNYQSYDQLTDVLDPATGSSSLAWDPDCIINQKLFAVAFQSIPYIEGNLWAFDTTANLPIVAQGATLNPLTGILSVNGCTGCTTSPLASSPQVGDTLLYNVNGDGTWDAVNYAQAFSSIYTVAGGEPITYGIAASGYADASGEGKTTVNATAILGPGWTASASASASTNTLIGFKAGENGNNSLFPLLAFYRWTFRFALVDATGSVRYWMGLGCYNNGSSTGTNSTAILNTTKFATNSPNSNFVGFRFSGGTDSHWQAASVIAGASPTVTLVDTGVTPDTNTHRFSMSPNVTGTAMNYFIDAKLVATITTLPNPAPSNASDGLGSMFWTGDNEDTATAVAATIWSMNIAMKQ